MAGIRYDRALTTALFHPLRRAIGVNSAGLPVLMYHRICANAEAGIAPYYQVNTSPAIFRSHLEYIAKEGWRTIDLATAANLLVRREPFPPKSIVITFDDGFKDFYTEAFPVLQEHHFSATVFLPTAFIQDKRRRFKGSECLIWDEVRLLRQAGIEFGSHTVNHPALVDLGWDEIELELRESKDQLEQKLSEPIVTFAYPFAFPQGHRAFADRFRGCLQEAGYICCATTEIGRIKIGSDPFRIKRLPANGLDDAKFLRAKLEGGYDWLGWPQDAIKRIKKTSRPGTKKASPKAAIEHAQMR